MSVYQSKLQRPEHGGHDGNREAWQCGVTRQLRRLFRGPQWTPSVFGDPAPVCTVQN